MTRPTRTELEEALANVNQLYREMRATAAELADERDSAKRRLEVSDAALSAALAKLAATERFVQVGWMGPYGIIPGGMDNDPRPTWKPIYMERPPVASSLVKGDSDGPV